MTPPATQQNQPTSQPPAQQTRPVNQPPAQQNHPDNLPPTGPITPTGGDRQPANGPQVARPVAGGNNLINPETAPPAVGPAPHSQADEIQSLKARLERYEKDGTPLANMHQPQVLFSDQDTIDRMKAITASSKDDGKKLVLPDVVPRFKASSLEVGKSPTVSCITFMYVATPWSHVAVFLHRA